MDTKGNMGLPTDEPQPLELESSENDATVITYGVNEAGNVAGHEEGDFVSHNDLRENEHGMEALVGLHNSDDEATIAEEEALEVEVDPAEELRLLSEDMGVSLKELLSYSGKRRARKSGPSLAPLEEPAHDVPSLIDVEASEKVDDLTTDSIVSPSESATLEVRIYQSSSSDSEEVAETSELAEFYFKSFLNNAPTADHCDSEVEDEEFLGPTMNVCEIKTGSNHQAEIPPQDFAAEPEEMDQLMWKESENFTEEELVLYLKDAWKIINRVQGTDHFDSADHPVALQCLLEASYDPQVALAMLQKEVQVCKENICEANIQKPEKNKIPIMSNEQSIEANCTNKMELTDKTAENNQSKSSKRKRNKKEDMGPAQRKPK